MRRQPRQRRLSLKTSCTALLLLAFAASGADIQPAHVRNFGEVNANLLRGATPSDEALRELKDLGVNVILDLREDGPARLHEKQVVEQLGMRYAHVPLASVAAPKQAEIAQALALITQQPSAKIYVHCWRGKDRTGTVIACYRIQHDGWDNQRALEEAKSFGMSRLQFAMQSYIRHFTPVKLAVASLP